jgi:hypothetical protein
MDKWAQLAVAVFIGLVGIASGLYGQAIYWGRFEGRVNSILLEHAELLRKLDVSRSSMWREINGHAERLVALETACHLTHGRPVDAVIVNRNGQG